jgi:hypothetical protein
MATIDPGARAIRIQYLNHRGEIKTYTGDRSTLKATGAHVSLRLAPTGKRVSFSKDCIQNRPEVEQALGQGSEPSAVEKQILGYHRKHGTTSPRFEEVRRKFPGYA